MCGGGAVCGSLMKCCCMTLRLDTAGPFYTITTQPALLWVCLQSAHHKIWWKLLFKFQYTLYMYALSEANFKIQKLHYYYHSVVSLSTLLSSSGSESVIAFSKYFFVAAI